MTKFKNTIMDNIIHTVRDLYKHTSAWGRVLIFFLLFAVIFFISKSFNKSQKKEGFTSNFSYLNDDIASELNSTDLSFDSKFSVKSSVSDIYDDFYANIYDDLLYYKFKNKYEIGTLITNTNPTSESIILDIGSGTGHYVGNLASKGYIIKGIDISPSMIKKAKQNYPEFANNFIHGDVLDINIVKPNSLTHINCMDFTIYYMQNKSMFFQNCMNWLMPGGYLLVHLVDKNNFNYTIPSSGLFNNDKNSEKILGDTRIIQNKVNIPKYNMEYSSTFEINNVNNQASINETFKKSTNDNKLIRKNSHNIYMESIDEINNMALNEGFILQGVIDMVNIENSRQNQYIYVFTKPN
jgi:2-polyprenyl-3-methyl-5-hydroxy-6-metoxy-1,4-benzoquinol methylase